MRLKIIVLCLLFTAVLFAEENVPYVFWTDNGAIIKQIVDGEVVTETKSEKADFIATIANKKTKIKRTFENDHYVFEKAKKMVFASDIHGQNGNFITLLKTAGVVGEELHWNFGDNYLVIVGDIMDRGPDVTASLWMLYRLEQEAEKVGGKVIVMLGNHEFMVLRGDGRYVHEKNKKTAAKMDLEVPELYGQNTTLGAWLRSKPVVVKIGDILLCHGGISPQLVEEKVDIKTVNETYWKFWDGKKRKEEIELLLRRYSPIWYRGYWMEKSLPSKKMNKILNSYDVNQVIVGHTTQDSISFACQKKVIGVDAGLKYGDTGEVLLLEDGTYYRILLDGSTKLLE